MISLLRASLLFFCAAFVAGACSIDTAAIDDGETNGTDSPTDSPDGTDTDTETDTGDHDDTVTDSSTDVDTEGCGNGVLENDERCDDANNQSGDGCSALCTVEKDYACPEPGEPCVSTVVCGDGVITGSEGCDDGNKNAGDGCSDSCVVEDGWACPDMGKRCVAAACGDTVIAGNEDCDDGNKNSGDGCSSACKREDGWVCDSPGTPCRKTVCNDGVREGSEPCDDGNNVVGDGCTPFCEVEPDCSAGACTSACGDGIILPSDAEECDDGNNLDGDGCSSACKTETGYECDEVTAALPPVLQVPITYRDFIGIPTGGGVKHPDFETYAGQGTPGLVEATLGSDGKPVYTGICEAGNITGPCPYGAQTTSKADFDQWYRSVPAVNKTKVTKLSLDRQPDGTYYFPTAAFFPWDGGGWVAAGKEAAYSEHNFAFTSELRYWFEFKGDEKLIFSGDDDVWVFINKKLALDLGGLHSKKSGSVTLDASKAVALGLVAGNIYEIVLFHAERHTHQSNFNLTLGGFVSSQSLCETICGDGIVVGDETCDDGVNDGSYGSCLEDCTGPGPRCGDAKVQSDEGEQCDDGINLATYSQDGTPGCAPGCVWGAYCGDGQIDSVFAEECDDGVNDGSYGGCTPRCKLGERCGDGIVQEDQGEECDDGNTVSGDGCSENCRKQGPI